jgi:hypothetical protein
LLARIFSKETMLEFYNDVRDIFGYKPTYGELRQIEKE